MEIVTSPVKNAGIEVFSTCPAFNSPGQPPRPGCYNDGGPTHVQRIKDVARWSEEAGCKGILVYIDNSLLDNWTVTQIIIENTNRLIPLVATQPIYMHPYWVAKQIATLGHLYGRRIALNMLAGGFKNDLTGLGDTTPHDKRYERMTEYTLVIQKLLEGSEPVHFEGQHYAVRNVTLSPSLPKELAPLVLMSGASPAGMAAARKLNAVAVRYPKPVHCYEEDPLDTDIKFGLRIGIIARDDEDLTWEIAHERFPEDRKGQVAHYLAMKTSDSAWHKQLSAMHHEELTTEFPYWLTPFQNYKTFCPYLVGSYERIARIVSRYIRVGFRTFITDIPISENELQHQKIVFDLASRYAGV